MRVDSNRPLRNVSSKRDAKTASGAERTFGDLIAGDTAPAPPAAPAVGIGSSLLVVQEVGDATAERRRALARGFSLLDRLDELRLALLAGRVDRDALTGLAQSVRSARSGVDDPALTAVLDEIELRAAVELAKLGQVP
jgi:class II flagellar assembly regulator FliX